MRFLPEFTAVVVIILFSFGMGYLHSLDYEELRRQDCEKAGWHYNPQTLVCSYQQGGSQ
jgi:hypothetical protein